MSGGGGQPFDEKAGLSWSTSTTKLCCVSLVDNFTIIESPWVTVIGGLGLGLLKFQPDAKPTRVIVRDVACARGIEGIVDMFDWIGGYPTMNNDRKIRTNAAVLRRVNISNFL